MTISSILVHLDTEPSCTTRVNIAKKLGAMTGAQVNGLFIEDTIDPTHLSALGPTAQLSDDLDPALLGQKDYQQLNAMRRSKVLQRIKTAQQGQKLNVTTEHGPATSVIADYSSFHDITIVSPSIPADTALSSILNPVIKIATESAGPLLIIPDNMKSSDSPPYFKKPLLIWDGNKESSRTLRAAIPLLQSSSDVSILTDRKHAQAAVDFDTSKQLIRAFLASKDIESHPIKPDNDDDSLEQQLSNILDKQEHDLIILAVYQHSKIKELLMGSHARRLIGTTRLPTLIAN